VIHFAILLPDWNSLESVRRAHSDFEGAALVFFALLVVSEALAHLTEDKNREKLFDRMGVVFFAVAVLAEIIAFPYGQRNDTLSERVIGSLDNKAQDAANKASKAVTDSGTAIGQAKEAETKSGHAVDTANKANAVSGSAQKTVEAVSKESERLTHDMAQVQSFLSGRFVTHPDVVVKALDQRFGGWNNVANGDKIREKLPPNREPPVLGKIVSLTSYVGDTEAFIL